MQKPTDLDLRCLLRQGMSCSAREGLRTMDDTIMIKCQIKMTTLVKTVLVYVYYGITVDPDLS